MLIVPFEPQIVCTINFEGGKEKKQKIKGLITVSPFYLSSPGEKKRNNEKGKKKRGEHTSWWHGLLHCIHRIQDLFKGKKNSWYYDLYSYRNLLIRTLKQCFPRACWPWFLVSVKDNSICNRTERRRIHPYINFSPRSTTSATTNLKGACAVKGALLIVPKSKLLTHN